MRRPRIGLQQMLEDILGHRRVYFNPPENLKMEYPCLRYELSKINNLQADNVHFDGYGRYELTYLTPNPDDPMVDKLLDTLPRCRFDRCNVYQGLYHFVYTCCY